MRACLVTAAALLLACNAPTSSSRSAPSGSASGSSVPVRGGATSYVLPDSLEREMVTFPSGTLTLTGYLYVPPGNGPFPAIVFNHGSEQEPGIGAFVARFYVGNGFVFFFPHRRGHGHSAAAGRYVGDMIDDANPWNAAFVDELVAQSDDVIAAAAYVATLPYVDRTRIATVGCSFGGIEALFAAEQGTGLTSAIDFAGASYMWARSPALRERMKRAAREAKVPVFFIQAENDNDTTPTKLLGEEMRQAGKPYRARVFPPYGHTTQQGHGFCGAGENAAWRDDVLAFLAETMKL